MLWSESTKYYISCGHGYWGSHQTLGAEGSRERSVYCGCTKCCDGLSLGLKPDVVREYPCLKQWVHFDRKLMNCSALPITTSTKTKNQYTPRVLEVDDQMHRTRWVARPTHTTGGTKIVNRKPSSPPQNSLLMAHDPSEQHTESPGHWKFRLQPDTIV